MLWANWLIIGRAFQSARTEAMYVADANQPGGRRYNVEMGRLLARYQLDAIGKTARAHLLRVINKLGDVEEWRSRQSDPDDFNHPTSVWQRYSRSSKGQDQKDKKRLDNSPAATIKKLNAQIEELEARCQELEEEKQQPKPKIDWSLEATRKRVEALGPSWELQQPCGRQRQYIIHEPDDWNGKCGPHVIRCRTLEIVNNEVDEIEKIIAAATPNELERLKTENKKLKNDVENMGRMWRANFQTVLEAGGIPRDLYVAVVACLHPDKPPPTAEQRAAAFGLFQAWKQELEKASRDA